MMNALASQGANRMKDRGVPCNWRALRLPDMQAPRRRRSWGKFLRAAENPPGAPGQAAPAVTRLRISRMSCGMPSPPIFLRTNELPMINFMDRRR